MKLPYAKEINCHVPKEINGFLKKLDFKVTFILINETFNLKRLFTFKERQNNLHRSGVVYRITCSCKSMYIGQTSRNLITRLKNHNPFFFFFLHCPLFREGCGGSSSRLSRHTSRSSITSIISLGRSPKRFHPRSSM